MESVQIDGQSHETAPNRSVETGGVRYAYRRFGVAGQTPLVLLQHFRGTMDNWDPAVVNPLAASRDVILFDNAGVGGSSGLPATSVAEMAYHVGAFAAALHLDCIDLFGFSMGGFAAQQVAIDIPALVRRLILAGTGPQGGERLDWRSNRDVTDHAAIDAPGAEDLMSLMFAHTETSQRRARAFVQRLGARTAEPDGPSTLAVRDAQMEAIGAWAVPGDGQYERLKTITQPVFVANGLWDSMCPAINSFILAQHLPQAFLVLYPDAGHGSIFQYPELFTEQALRFLSPAFLENQ
jgi:pimeloyl-ACP methyl ester carboxylesterase